LRARGLDVLGGTVVEVVDDDVHADAGEAYAGPAEAVEEVDWHFLSIGSMIQLNWPSSLLQVCAMGKMECGWARTSRMRESWTCSTLDGSTILSRKASEMREGYYGRIELGRTSAARRCGSPFRSGVVEVPGEMQNGGGRCSQRCGEVLAGFQHWNRD
jgi:hypothetical protein